MPLFPLNDAQDSDFVTQLTAVQFLSGFFCFVGWVGVFFGFFFFKWNTPHPFHTQKNNWNVPYFHGYLPAGKEAGQDPGTAGRRLAVGQHCCISEKLLWSYGELLQNGQISVALHMNSPWSKNTKETADKGMGMPMHREFTNEDRDLTIMHGSDIKSARKYVVQTTSLTRLSFSLCLADCILLFHQAFSTSPTHCSVSSEYTASQQPQEPAWYKKINGGEIKSLLFGVF